MSLEEMQNVDPRTVDRSKLVQLNTVCIDPKAEKSERIKEFVAAIRNPYCFLVGKTVVKLGFADNERTIEDCVCSYLKGL